MIIVVSDIAIFREYKEFGSHECKNVEEEIREYTEMNDTEN